MRIYHVSFWIALGVLTTGMVFGEMFKDGETVCFLGDSITNGGRYQNKIFDYYLTRFPGWTIRFINAGRSGDTAGGALSKRVKEDVIDVKPTSVAIMFGMNDVGRGNYVQNPTEKDLTAQQRNLNGFKLNMEKLVKRIRDEASDPKMFFMTPSPFDQTVVLDRDNNQPGCNDGLGRCGEIVRELAAKNGGRLIDFHGPMTAFNLAQQKKDPTYTLVGKDRVHPGAPGLMMMAWLFLKEQGVSPVVSRVALDAAAGRVTENVNAEVTQVEKKGNGISFTVLEKALPFPIDPGASSMLALLPIEKDLNQEILSVTGLSAGTYELQIDDIKVGTYTADDLKNGLSLGFNQATPQYKQAQAVAKLNEQRRRAECRMHDLLNTRRWMKNHYKIDVDNPAAVQAHYDHFEDKTSHSANMAKNYIQYWSNYDEFGKEMIRYEQELFASRTLQPHAYAIMPLENTK